MAFVLPNFNLLCDIWTPDVPNVAAIPIGAPRSVNNACALVYGRRVNVASTGGTSFAGIMTQQMNLLFPALFDVRGPQDVTSFDIVEVPSGSGRWYQVTFVDDIGKGYANEHRSAGILALVASWPHPAP